MERDVFIQTRLDMNRALRQAGVDPLAAGSVLMHLEQLAAYVIRIHNRLDRLEKKITRRETRQKGKKRQKATKNNVVPFSAVRT